MANFELDATAQNINSALNRVVSAKDTAVVQKTIANNASALITHGADTFLRKNVDIWKVVTGNLVDNTFNFNSAPDYTLDPVVEVADGVVRLSVQGQVAGGSLDQTQVKGLKVSAPSQSGSCILVLRVYSRTSTLIAHDTDLTHFSGTANGALNQLFRDAPTTAGGQWVGFTTGQYVDWDGTQPSDIATAFATNNVGYIEFQALTGVYANAGSIKLEAVLLDDSLVEIGLTISLQADTYTPDTALPVDYYSTVGGVVTPNTAYLTDEFVGTINSLTFTSTIPAGGVIKALVSLDDGTTWNYFNTGVLTAVDPATITTNGNTLAEMATGFTAYAVSAMSGLLFKFHLSTTDQLVTPSIDNIAISYTPDIQHERVSHNANFKVVALGSSMIEITNLSGAQEDLIIVVGLGL